MTRVAALFFKARQGGCVTFEGIGFFFMNSKSSF